MGVEVHEEVHYNYISMIGLVDCNNFFVSCERLFRPDLIGKPVAVLSSNDGCIVARSQEVKDMGIPMGAPFFQVRDVCKKENVTLFSSNFALYRDISSRVMSALADECDTYEIYSIDEAFFEVPDSVHVRDIQNMRTRIMKKTGIPVSIGIAPTMTLAKVAGSIAKKNDGRRMSIIPSTPNFNTPFSKNVRRPTSHILSGEDKEDGFDVGVCILGMEEWREVARTISCGSIWGIGRQTAPVLAEHGVNTASEFIMKDRVWIRDVLGVVGERLHMELLGVPVHHIGVDENALQESYMSTRSFPAPVKDKRVLMSALTYHTEHLAEKLRRDGCVAKQIAIVVRASRFGDFAHRESIRQRVLVLPTNNTATLLKEVATLLDTLYDPNIPYKKAGVVVRGIEPESFTTNTLFSPVNENRELDTVTDILNERFGKGTLTHASALGSEKWRERTELKSPNYTTAWDEIATIKAT